MSSGAALTGVIRHLNRGDAAPDSELLSRYALHRDEAAFAAVVERYGGLVLGVARRQLAGSQNADDVFQATFLALARCANRLHERTPLANWLYTVALRQARKARARDHRRAALEQSLPPRRASADPLDAISGRDLLRLIDEELARLPEKYRQPVLLCCVQGLSRDDAAARLGLTGGRLKGRLERGRKRLADRLSARGLAPVLVLGTVVVAADLQARTLALAANPWAKSLPPGVVGLVAPRGPRGWVLAATLALVPFGLAGWAVGTAPKESAVTAAADPPAAVPPDGVSQFGSPRFRHGTEISSLAVSPDGKRAVASSGQHWLGSARGYDLADGRAIFTLPGDFQRAEAVAISPDGKLVAAKQWAKIGLFDAGTGAAVRTLELPARMNGINTTSPWLTFSPDGKTIAFIGGHGDNAGREITLVGVEQGNVVATLMSGHMVYGVSFSPDGKRLVGGGHDNDKGKYFARLWDIQTGAELRKLPHGQNSLRAVAFSPDGKTIAAGGDDGWARIWDAETGKELHSLPGGGPRVRSVAFAPDGKTLAVAGGAVRLIDPVTAAVKVTIPRKVSAVHFDADGRAITAAVAGAIHRWDAATGNPLTPQDGCDSAVDQVAVTPDGKHLLARDQGGEAHLWDAATGRHLRRFPMTWQRGFALSPDGRFVVWPAEVESVQFPHIGRQGLTRTGNRLKLYDLAEGKFVDRFPTFEGDANDSTFTADGKSLVTVDHLDATVRVWDVAAGKEVRSFRAVREDDKDRVWFARLSVVAPDGKTLAVAYDRADNTTALVGPVAVRLWDMRTGAELRELSGHMNRVESVTISPDGRWVVTSGEAGGRLRGASAGGQTTVWGLATGTRAAQLSAAAHTTAAAFSRDGRTLATASADGAIRLWEVATWTMRAELRPHAGRVSSIIFAPDGRLFTGSLDATVVATSVRPRGGAGGWDELASANAATAFAAQGHLLADPAKAVALLADKLKPAAPPDAKELAGLMADLDSADFATREAAGKRLREMGRVAAGALRDGAKSDSPEVRKRANDLLAVLEQATSPDDLRARRAVEVLEWVGTAASRKLLGEWASGAPDARLTTEAKAALGRIEDR